ncbi:hypothetical protein [Chryseobacterium sp. ON_d1]
MDFHSHHGNHFNTCLFHLYLF